MGQGVATALGSALTRGRWQSGRGVSPRDGGTAPLGLVSPRVPRLSRRVWCTRVYTTVYPRVYNSVHACTLPRSRYHPRRALSRVVLGVKVETHHTIRQRLAISYKVRSLWEAERGISLGRLSARPERGDSLGGAPPSPVGSLALASGGVSLVNALLLHQTSIMNKIVKNANETPCPRHRWHCRQ